MTLLWARDRGVFVFEQRHGILVRLGLCAGVEIHGVSVGLDCCWCRFGVAYIDLVLASSLLVTPCG